MMQWFISINRLEFFYPNQTLSFMKFLTRAYVVNTIAALLIFIFAYAAISKFFNYEIFRYNLKDTPLVGDKAPVIAIILSVVNLIPVILLSIPQSRKAGLLYSFILLLFYSGYIGYSLLTATQLPCSCSGIVSWLTWKQHLWADLAFAALAFIAFLLSKRVIAIHSRPWPVPATGNAENL
jgi:putative oxidoreductase